MGANKYGRVLLKLSGEAIAEKDEKDNVVGMYDEAIISRIAGVIRTLTEDGVEVGVVIGAGNIWRGAKNGKIGDVRRARADQMGMLATTMNCLRLEEALEDISLPAAVMSPVGMSSFTEPYDFRKAVEYMKNGKVVIFAAGLGVPYITTDTAGVVRGAEIGADIVLMAKNIDGIYVRDPRRKDGTVDRSVPRYKVISYAQSLKDNLKATDAAAAAIAEEQKINMYVFSLAEPENILRVVRGEEIGTFVTWDKDAEAEFYPVG
ncbi:MAG: UMP kinase [Clostridia bacterium]|nr:UMP kinase [Clostridia bacterium]